MYDFMRGATHPWRIDTFVKYNSKCALSGESKDKIVHHVNIPFRKVINRCHKELHIKQKRFINEYSESDLLKLKELCLKIHNEFHHIYGNRNNTYDQFIEFSNSKGIDMSIIIDNELKIA